MHHAPEHPAPRARRTGGLSRAARATRRALGHRSGRLALSTLLSTVVTALVLAAPVVAGQGTPPSPVILGQDGVPSSDTFAGLTSAATFSSSTGETSAVPRATRSSAAPTSAAPSATAPAVPEPVAPAPVVPEPAPAPAPVVVAEPEPEAEAPVTAAAPAPPASGGTEDQVVALVNQERAAAGCGPVSADGGLASVARAHSEDMRDRGFFDHVNLEGLDPFDRADRAGVAARAENIARGQVDAADVMNSWMNSAGHRANILDCGLTRLGVGIAEGGGGPWWTQLFG